MIPATGGWILIQETFKSNYWVPKLCWGQRGKYLGPLPPETPGHSLRTPWEDPTLPFHRSTPESPALSSHCRLPGGTSPPPRWPHPVRGSSTHTTRTILCGHIRQRRQSPRPPGVPAQLEPRGALPDHSVPLPRKGHCQPCSDSCVPPGQRRLGAASPQPPALALQGAPSPVKAGPGPGTAHAPSLHGKALHNTARTHPKRCLSSAPQDRRALSPQRARSGLQSAALPRRARLQPQLPHSPFPSPLPLTAPPEFWFELVTGSNHHIPQAAGAHPGAGAGAVPPGRVWEWAGGESAASGGEGAVPRAGPPHRPPLLPPPVQESP